jgi:hypothetical protein
MYQALLIASGGPQSPPIVLLQGKNSKERTKHRNALRAKARSSGQPLPKAVAPVPPTAAPPSAAAPPTPTEAAPGTVPPTPTDVAPRGTAGTAPDPPGLAAAAAAAPGCAGASAAMPAHTAAIPPRPPGPAAGLAAAPPPIPAPPPFCTRAGAPWGQPPNACHCHSGDWERYLLDGEAHGWAKKTTTNLRCSDGEVDLTPGDVKVSWWRVGGPRSTERLWYEAAILHVWALTLPCGRIRQVVCGNAYASEGVHYVDPFLDMGVRLYTDYPKGRSENRLRQDFRSRQCP